MKRLAALLLFLLVALSAQAADVTTLPVVVIGAFTSRPTCDVYHDRWIYWSTDATAANSCSAGGGTTLAQCICVSGTGWVSLGILSSSSTGFFGSGALTCGAGTAGKALVHTTPLQYCDNTATPTLRYSAYGDSSGNATGVACTTCVDATDIASNAVTLPKIVNATTNNRLLGRATAGSGNWEEITLGTNLTYSGTTLNAASGGAGGWDVANRNTVDQNTTSGSLVDVTGLTYAIPSTGTYEFEVALGLSESTSNGSELGLGYTGTGTVTAMTVTHGGTVNNVNGAGIEFGAPGSGNNGVANCTQTTTICMSWMYGILYASTTGTLSVKYDRLTTGTATAKANSVLKVRKIG